MLSYTETYRPVVEPPRLPPDAVHTTSVPVAVTVPPVLVLLNVMSDPSVVYPLVPEICTRSVSTLSVVGAGASVWITAFQMSVVPNASINLLQSFSIAVSYLRYVAMAASY